MEMRNLMVIIVMVIAFLIHPFLCFPLVMVDERGEWPQDWPIDGKVIDLNRIIFPPETPIFDKR